MLSNMQAVSPTYLTLWSVSPDIMLRMGYSLEEIQDSLINQKYNDVMATYLLLDYRNSEVCYSEDHINICVCACNLQGCNSFCCIILPLFCFVFFVCCFMFCLFFLLFLFCSVLFFFCLFFVYFLFIFILFTKTAILRQ